MGFFVWLFKALFRPERCPQCRQPARRIGTVMVEDGDFCERILMVHSDPKTGRDCPGGHRQTVY